MRPKTCPTCRERFTPTRSLQMVCSPLCAAGYAEAIRKKREAKEHKEAKSKLKTRATWLKETQAVFNKWVRLRDKDKPCICCGKPLTKEAIGGGFDCGHYRSIGSAPHLRFDERNAHGQTKQCNRWGSGRAVDYRIGLISRIGLSAVESLEADQTTKKYTIDELKAIKAEYSKRIRGME